MLYQGDVPLAWDDAAPAAGKKMKSVDDIAALKRFFSSRFVRVILAQGKGPTAALKEFMEGVHYPYSHLTYDEAVALEKKCAMPFSHWLDETIIEYTVRGVKFVLTPYNLLGKLCHKPVSVVGPDAAGRVKHESWRLYHCGTDSYGECEEIYLPNVEEGSFISSGFASRAFDFD